MPGNPLESLQPEKLAYATARRITEEIVDRGWVVGERLGTEAELLARYQISREPFREALRLLERQGVIRTERGARGGIVVQAPALTAVSNIVKSYVEFSDISFWELSEAVTLLAYYGIELAVARMTPAHANDLLRAIPRPRPSFRSRDQEGLAVSAIFDAIFRVAADPCLAMIHHSFSRALADFGHQERYPSATWKDMIGQVWHHAEQMAVFTAQRKVAAALEQASGIDRVVKNVLTGLEEKFPKTWNTRSFLGGSVASPSLAGKSTDKLAVTLAYRIAAHVRKGDMQAGEAIGSEAALIEHFGARRAQLREALRMLEFFGVLTVKRGAVGGLIVADPDPTMTIDSALIYLAFYQPNQAHLEALLNRIEAELSGLSSKRATHSDLSALIAQLERLAATALAADTKLAASSYRQLIECGANRALGLIVEFLNAYLRRTAGGNSGRAEQTGRLNRVRHGTQSLAGYLASGQVDGVDATIRGLLMELRTLASDGASQEKPHVR